MIYLSGGTTNKDTERASSEVGKLGVGVTLLPNNIDGLARSPGRSGNWLSELCRGRKMTFKTQGVTKHSLEDVQQG